MYGTARRLHNRPSCTLHWTALHSIALHFDVVVCRLFVQLSSSRRESGSSSKGGVGVDRRGDGGGGGDSSPADLSSRMPLIVISADAQDRHSLLGRPSGAPSSSAD